MSIELSVSSTICRQYTTNDIAKILVNKKILGTVLPMTSSVDYNGEFYLENGFRIWLYSLEKERFCIDVWEPLKDLLGLDCAHIRCDSYIGCVKNWPGVMSPCKCKKS